MSVYQPLPGHTVHCGICHRHWSCHVDGYLLPSTGCCNCNELFKYFLIHANFTVFPPAAFGATFDAGSMKWFSVLAKYLFIWINLLVAGGTVVTSSPLWCHLLSRHTQNLSICVNLTTKICFTCFKSTCSLQLWPNVFISVVSTELLSTTEFAIWPRQPQ